MAARAFNFASNVLKLVAGNALASVVMLLSAPVLTRLFPPDAFGMAAVFVSMATILELVSCLRYEVAILLPEEDHEAANLFGLSLVATAFVTVLTAVAVLFAGQAVANAFNMAGLARWLWLLPVSVAAYGSTLGVSHWLIRKKRFGELSASIVLRSVVEAGGRIGSGVLGMATGGVFITWTVLGRLARLVFVGWRIRTGDYRAMRSSINLRGMVAGMKRYRKFPLITTWSVLTSNIAYQVPFWLLAAFFNPQVVGFYAIGNRVMRVPLSVMGQAVAQVFMQRAAEVKLDRAELAQTTESLFRRLVSISCAGFLLLLVNGRDIFRAVFGAEWGEAGIYAQILAPALFLSFVVSPLSVLFSILERQEKGLLFNIFFCVASVAALAGGALTRNVRVAVLCFATVRALSYTMLSVWLFRLTGVPVAKIVRHLVKYGSCAVAALLPLILVKWLLGMTGLVVLAAGAFGVAVYYILVFREDAQLLGLVKAAIERSGTVRQEAP